jgi:hypothetical protein
VEELLAVNDEATPRDTSGCSGAPAWPWAAYKGVFEALRAMYIQLDAEHSGILPLDATGVFAEESEVTYVDHCHLAPRGRQLLAAAIGERILEILEQRGA